MIVSIEYMYLRAGSCSSVQFDALRPISDLKSAEVMW
jgi:hypothetical protein